MNGKQRLQSGGSDAPASSKRRKTGAENEKSSKENSSKGRAASTPIKDRKSWTQVEEINLVKMMLEHKKVGRVVPLQSKTAPYWIELITMLYPGENGISERRIYDKVRRMQNRYTQCKVAIVDKKETEPWKNSHEKTLFDIWDKIFIDEMSRSKTSREPQARQGKVPNGNSVKVVEVYESSSEEEEEDDHEEERVPIAKAAPKAGPPVEPSSGSEEDEDEDEDEEEEDSSPEKRSVHSGQNASRVEATSIPQELRKVASLPKDRNYNAGVKAGSNQSGGNNKEANLELKDPMLRERKAGSGADQAVLDADFVKSLKAELFDYVQNLRNDCMRELDEVKSLLTNPARLQMARRRQELILEELSLQEKELEINRRYCRLQKEALQLQPAC